MPQFFYKVVSSPLGWIRIVTSEKHLIRIDFPSRDAKSSKRAPEILKKTEKQIREYFSGMGEKFALAIPFANLEGTSFQRRVWKAMSKIP
ncbi:MAG: cysteine methyltransferase, partial [Deltaproteobacteria bacterium]|nr:cysteine methyltransferase [Deltaproteobacteria bacterium]